MENKKIIKVFRFIILILFIVFISLFISQKTGYYDYGTYKKTILTKEAIEKFEQDVKEGKNIHIENYIGEIEKDYGNKISNTGLYFSKRVDNAVRSGMNKIFESLSNMIEND